MSTGRLDTGAAERVRIPYGATHVAALARGAHDAPSVLLVPGYTGSKEDFAPVLAPLADTGLRVVAIDLPGQHESPALPDGEPYTPDRLAEVVRSVASALGAPVRFVGHSFGGLVARAAVIAEPGIASSLVLLCSGPAALGGLRRQRIEALEPVLSESGLPGVYAAMLAAESAADGYVAPTPELAELLERRFLGGSPAMLQGMGDALRVEPDRVAELASAGVPVLVTHGVDDDAWEPASQRSMAERLGAAYEVLPGCAHSPAVENPAALVAGLLRFWTLNP